MFYQMLLGSWPPELWGLSELNPELLQPYVERLKSAMIKSVREAKTHSNWVAPNQSYEDAVRAFVDLALDTKTSDAFFSLFLPFAERISRLGVQNSLVQTALKLTVPAVPDIYQGSELWNLSLVDPDNRGAVDYEHRIRLLERLDGAALGDLSSGWRDGSIKLLIVRALLCLRAVEPELFAQGSYEPLVAEGPKADRICAFARHYEEKMLIVLTARFPARREADPDWEGTAITLPSGIAGSELLDAITGAAVCVTDSQIPAEIAFRDLPVAVLSAKHVT